MLGQAPEWGEDLRQVSLRDAGSVVTDAEDVLAVCSFDAEPDRTGLLVQEFDRVGQHVVEDLAKPTGVGVHFGQVVWHRDLDPSPSDLRAKPLQHLIQEWPRRDGDALVRLRLRAGLAD